MAKNSRKVVKIPTGLWKLKWKATRDSLTMAELKGIIESERRGQIEENGMDTESNHACRMMEMIWLIANKYEEPYDAEIAEAYPR